jgi:hypothetical protein
VQLLGPRNPGAYDVSLVCEILHQAHNAAAAAGELRQYPYILSLSHASGTSFGPSMVGFVFAGVMLTRLGLGGLNLVSAASQDGQGVSQTS